MRSAAPLWEQLTILILGPLIMTMLIWIVSRAWAMAVQGGTANDKTKRRQRVEFYVTLITMYIIGFGMAIYAWSR